MGKVETTPDLATAYNQYRKRLFGALALLARRGLAVQLADGLDLIQEFFSEAWAGLEVRYDPQRGPFDRYVFGAFVRFARPRILRLQRWQNCLVDAAKLADLVSANPVGEPATLNHPKVDSVRQVLLTFAPRDRKVLFGYLHTGGRGERKLARAFALSRYRVREMLGEILGQFVVRLGEHGAISASDWEVALALWRDGRTVLQSAGFLCRSVAEIRASRSRIIALLAGGLRRLERGHSSALRSRAMPALQVPPLELLKRVLSEVGNYQLLEEVRNRAEELLSSLDEAGGRADEEINALETNPEWLVLIHEALAGEEALSPAEEAVRAELFQARIDDEKSVGRAFTEALLADLPKPLLEWSYWFERVPRLSAEQRNYLLQQPAVQAALPAAAELVVFGLTPVNIYYATEAVGFVAGEALNHGRRAGTLAIRIGVEEFPLRHLPELNKSLFKEPDSWVRWEDGGSISPQVLVQEIVQMTECPFGTAHALLPWLVALAQVKPFLFPDFEALPSGKTAVQLTPLRPNQGKTTAESSADGKNLYWRWGRTS